MAWRLIPATRATTAAGRPRATSSRDRVTRSLTPSPSLNAVSLSTLRRGAASVSVRSRAGAQFSFGARAAHHVRSELSRLLNSQAGRQAARGWPELAGTVGAVVQAAAGLNGCWRDHTCQTAIRILRATADLAALPLPWRSRTST